MTDNRESKSVDEWSEEDWQRSNKEVARRLAAMTPAEREAYDASFREALGACAVACERAGAAMVHLSKTCAGLS